MKRYLPRIVDKVLKDELEAFGAVLITGPKWCGKTTSAQQLARSILKMQNPQNREGYILTAQLDPVSLLKGDNPRLIDEWQVAPELWDAIRYDIDERQEEGLYILTGSSNVDESKINHTGTGRISRLHMRTMSLFESRDSNGLISLEGLFNGEEYLSSKSTLKLEDISNLIIRGGWPGSVEKSIDIAKRRVNSYIDNIVKTEIKTFDGVERDEAKTLAVLKSLARHTATQASDATIVSDVEANNFSIHRNTLNDYLSVLRELYIIEDLPAWSPKLRSKTTIRTSNTRHFIDPAFAASLLKATPKGLLKDLNTMGLLFESLAIRDVRIYANYFGAYVSHYRDKTGLEADAIIHTADGDWAAIEVKLGGSQIDEAASNLIKLSKKVDSNKKPAFLAVITATEYGYKRKDGVYVIPLGCLKP